MKSLASGAGLLVAVAAALAFAHDAHACSPPPPGLVASVPGDGASYPANAALLFQGFDITLDAVTVTVGGQPAAFVAAPDVDALGLGALAARISPEPQPGQTVELGGTFCPDVGCGPAALTFTAGEPDHAPPGSPTAISFDLYDHADFVSSGGDCQSDTDLTWYVHVDTVVAPTPSESAPALLVEAFRDASFQEVVFSRSKLLTDASATLSMGYTVFVLDGLPAPEALCFRASVRDLAGNAAIPIVEACKPCNYRTDDAGGEDSSPPEPTWTSADVYPGGPCDAGGGGGGSGGSGGGGGGSGGSGGGGGAAAGCGCGIPAEETPGAAVALVALLVGAAAGRRRRGTATTAERG